MRDQPSVARKKAKGTTRERILEAATAAFARYGYTATRLDDIARRVGIRRPSLFHHFKDKPTLYQAVWEKVVAEQGAVLAPHFNAPDIATEKLLDVAVDAWVRYAFKHRDSIYLALFAAAAGRTGDLPMVADTTVARWENLLRRGVAEGVFNDVPLADCIALIGGMTCFYLVSAASLPVIKRSYTNDRDAFSRELRTLVRTLLLKNPAAC